MADVFGIKSAFGIVALAGYILLYQGGDELGSEPEPVDPEEAYCQVVVSRDGSLSRAFIRETDTGKALYRFEPSGYLDDAIIKYGSDGREIAGNAVAGEDRLYGTFYATQKHCIVTNYQHDARSYARK